jgi:hypothetical protein
LDVNAFAPRHLLTVPLSPAAFGACAAALVACGALYCVAHEGFTGGGVQAWVSLSWAALMVLPWLLAFEGIKRIGRTDRAWAWRFAAGAAALAAALLTSVLFERALTLAVHGELASSVAHHLFRRLPLLAVALVAAAALLALRASLGPVPNLREDPEAPNSIRNADNSKGEADSVSTNSVSTTAPALDAPERPPEAPNRSGDTDDSKDAPSNWPITPDCIEWIAAAGNYIELHAFARQALVRTTLHEAEAALPLVRVHRSVLVNPRHVARLERRDGRIVAVLTASGRRLPVGRSYARELPSRLAVSGGLSQSPAADHKASPPG